jgi:hypothetical protein
MVVMVVMVSMVDGLPTRSASATVPTWFYVQSQSRELKRGKKRK